MAARRGRKATEELKRGDSDVESSLLQPEKRTVDERQATVVVEIQSVDVIVLHMWEKPPIQTKLSLKILHPF